MTAPVLHIGISTKLYLSYDASLAWLRAVASIVTEHPIGAAEPAAPEHVRATVGAITRGLPEALTGTPIIYGGSAGPGLLQRLRPEIDGLFLGRSAHDPEQVRIVLDEAAAEARTTPAR